MKIYTKTGDDGMTGLYRAPRIAKSSLRIDAIGEVDELNASLGMALVELADSKLSDELTTIQRRLFDLGAELASPTENSETGVHGADIEGLERSIDAMDSLLPALTAFILPGGSRGAAGLHFARTICRRAERKVFILHEEEPLREEVRKYLNRLSDWLFTAARLCNVLDSVRETEWKSRAQVERK